MDLLPCRIRVEHFSINANTATDRLSTRDEVFSALQGAEKVGTL